MHIYESIKYVLCIYLPFRCNSCLWPSFRSLYNPPQLLGVPWSTVTIRICAEHEWTLTPKPPPDSWGSDNSPLSPLLSIFPPRWIWYHKAAQPLETKWGHAGASPSWTPRSQRSRSLTRPVPPLLGTSCCILSLPHFLLSWRLQFLRSLEQPGLTRERYPKTLDFKHAFRGVQTEYPSLETTSHRPHLLFIDL